MYINIQEMALQSLKVLPLDCKWMLSTFLCLSFVLMFLNRCAMYKRLHQPPPELPISNNKPTFTHVRRCILIFQNRRWNWMSVGFSVSHFSIVCRRRSMRVRCAFMLHIYMRLIRCQRHVFQCARWECNKTNNHE